MRNFRIIISALFYLCVLGLHAQTQLPKVVPLAPNAAALAKYGDIPVSYYTGTANVSIPLYTIQSGDIQLPIDLSYHTSGIRVNELAGWTGLGWTLNAGGVVTRTLMDKDDLAATPLLPEVISKGQMVKSLYDLSPQTVPPHDKGFTSTRGEFFDFTSALNGNIEFYDTEYDIFNYNVNGLTGRFILTRNTRQAIQERKSDVKIIAPQSSSQPQFKLIDPQGFIYTFNYIETASLPPTTTIYNTAWYLTRIESPKGAEINFEYDLTVLPTLASTNYFTPFGGCSGLQPSVTGVTANFPQAAILKRINFEGGYVDFTHDENRTDYSAKRITGLKVYRTGSAVPVKEFDFVYSYFGTERMKLDKVIEKSGGLVLPPYEFTYNTSFLPALTSKDIDYYGYFNNAYNSTLVPVYRGPLLVNNVTPSNTMSYDFIELPGANREVNENAIKAFSLSEIKYPTGGKTLFELEANTYEYNSSEAVREIYSQYVKKDTVLQFSSRSLVTGSLSWIENLNYSELKVTIGFVCTHPSNGCQLYRGNVNYPYGSIYFEINGVRRDIDGGLVTCGGPQCQAILTFPPLSNQLDYVANIASNVGNDFTMISVNLEWYERLFQQSNNKSRAQKIGGLRVKQITDIGSQNEVVKHREYNYHYQMDTNADGILEIHSYGKRTAPPNCFRNFLDVLYDPVPPSLNGTCYAFQRYASSTNPLGSAVGYDRVEEIMKDANGADLGKTIYYFFNKQDSIYKFTFDQPSQYVSGSITSWGGPGYIPALNTRTQGLLNLSYKTNGSLRRKDVLRREGSTYQIVNRQRNSYQTEIINNYFSFQKEMHQVNGPTICLAFIYPAVRHERVFHTQTTDEIFDSSDTTKVSVTQTINTYGVNHEQIVKVTKTDPLGRLSENVVVYPPDYGNLSVTTHGVKNLKDLNILAPIEQYTIVNGNVTAGTISTYKETSPLLDKIYQLETPVPIASASFNQSNKVNNTISLDSRYKERINYKQYDTEGNPIELAKTDDGDISYLWGYEKRYPIAEIKNASYGQVAYTSFESTPNEGNWTFAGSPTNVIAAKIGKFVYALSPTSTLGKGLVPGKYYLEYYAKAPITIAAVVAPVTVDVTTSLPDANGWIYYKKEVTITGSTTLTLSTGGTPVYVDEVKVYPVQAQMTTYVFDPLIGVTHMIDPNGIISYYEYDSFNRLRFVRDGNNNILRNVDYKYGNQ